MRFLQTVCSPSEALTETGSFLRVRVIAYACCFRVYVHMCAVLLVVHVHIHVCASCIVGGVFSKTEMSEVLTEICKMDPSFDMELFIRECRDDIIPNVLEAILRGDLEILEDWCHEAVRRVRVCVCVFVLFTHWKETCRFWRTGATRW